jgi:hypothetical protein
MDRLKPLGRTASRAFFILLCLLLPAGGSSASGCEGGTDPGFPVFLHADASFFANNLEYFNGFVEGKTFFGAETSLYFTVDRPSFDFSLGVFLKREFGDEEGLSEVLPLFRFRYKTPWCRFTLGFIDSRNNHGLPEALLAQQYPFYYPVEEGTQFQVFHRNLRADAWINWYLLNTPEYREFLAGGLRASGSWRPFSVELAMRLSHHGGQQYEVGRVTNSLGGMVRAGLSHTWPALDADFGVLLTAYGSADYQEKYFAEEEDRHLLGYGGEAECFFAPWGWKLYYRVFFGNDFLVEQGDPLYRTEKPLHRFGVRKSLSIHDLVRARLQFEGVVVESELDYNYLVVVDVFLDLFLHRFGGPGG